MTIGFENEEYTVREDQSFIEVCVSLLGQIERNVTADISLAVGGSASPSQDFQFSPITVNFNETSGSRMCAFINQLQDDAIEPVESIFLNLMLSMENETGIMLNISRAEIVIEDSSFTTLDLLNSTSDIIEGEAALLCVRNNVTLERTVPVEVVFEGDLGGEDYEYCFSGFHLGLWHRGVLTSRTVCPLVFPSERVALPQ